MSILCRVVEWYVDYTDKSDAIPSWIVKHAHACGSCQRQVKLSRELRTMTKQAFDQVPSEPFGGFKPLSIRSSMLQTRVELSISPGLWIGSLVAAVVLAIIGTDYSHREMFVAPSVASTQSSVGTEQSDSMPSYGLFDMKSLAALIPDVAVPADSQQAHIKQLPRSNKGRVMPKIYLANVPVVPVKPRAVDRQLLASTHMLNIPSAGDPQVGNRVRQMAMTLRDAPPLAVSTMAKSVLKNMEETDVSTKMASSGGGGSAATRVMLGAGDSIKTSSAMMPVPMESRGIPTESGLSL